MFLSLVLPLLASDTANVVVEPTTAELVVTAPNPAVFDSIQPTTAELIATAPDPTVNAAGTITTAELTLTAPDPNILGADTTLGVPPAILVATAPDPLLRGLPTILQPDTANLALFSDDPLLLYGYVASTLPPGFHGVPIESTNPKEHSRQIATVLNRLQQGKGNSASTITLNASVEKTYWRDPRLAPDSQVSFDPVTASAAAEKAAGTLFILEDDRQGGQWLITHANDASTDRKFRVTIQG